MRYALSANLMQSSVFAYIAGAPFVYIDHFHLTPQQFAWMFGCNAIGLMIVGRINAHLVSVLGPELIFRRAMRGTAALGIVLLGTALAGVGGFWAMAIPQLLFVSMLGFNFANGLALALAPLRRFGRNRLRLVRHSAVSVGRPRGCSGECTLRRHPARDDGRHVRRGCGGCRTISVDEIIGGLPRSCRALNL